MDSTTHPSQRAGSAHSSTADHPFSHRDGSTRTSLIRLLGLGLLVGAIGFTAGQAIAGDGGFGSRFFGSDPAKAEARMEKMARHLAVEADATPEQQQQLAGIARAAAKDIAPLRAKMRDHRERTMALLAAPTIDRGAVEALRAEQMANADTLSRRIAQAATDAAEVLTPEQRQKLAAHMAEKRARQGRHGHRDGEGRGPWSSDGQPRG